jgi:hypothetical protein
MHTIVEAKQYLKDNIKKGVKCPCCGQFAKLYSRKINSGMVLFLIGLYRLSKRNGIQEFSNDFVFKEMDLNVRSLDYSILKHFGLIQESVNTDSGKKKSGNWIITEAGINFAEGKVSVAENVLIYNNKVIGFEGKNILISEISKFNYKDL